jgi:LacI family transcriptional regulator
MIRWEQYTTADEMIREETIEVLNRLDVTALVCSHDVIAIRALRTLWDLGISAPKQMSVVGFDDIPWAGLATPSLTTIRQPFEAMGSAAVELLVERIASPNRRTRHITLDVTLVERESVGTLEQAGRARRPKERLHIGV